MNEKKLFLLDAMALIYRAYFAFKNNPRVNSAGMNTSAIFGFANVLLDLLKKEQPSHLGVAFDTMAPTLRQTGYEAYKAQRQETPEDIINAIPLVQELLYGFRIPVLFSDGYEADDVIGTLAKKAEKLGFTTYMMTSDKDFGQLVSDSIFIYKPGKFGSDPETLGVKEVCDRFGIKRPEQIIDLLGLWGDASDNIPGIPGVGEVIAKKLLAEYDTVENLISQADTISKESLRQKVIANKEQALLSKQLATIILNVPITFDEEQLRLKRPDELRLKKLFDLLEFRTYSQRVATWIDTAGLEKAAPTAINTEAETCAPDLFDVLENQEEQQIIRTIQNTPHHYQLIDTPEKRTSLLNELEKQPAFCFDTETTGLDPGNSEIVGISFSWKPGEACYIPLPDHYDSAHQILREFKNLLENPTTLKIGQNLKFDISILKWYDIRVQGPLFDTMLAHYLIQPDMRHGMDFLAETYLHYQPVPIEQLIGKKGQHQLSMRTVDLESIKEYAAEDADITLQLKEKFEPLLKEASTRDLFDTIEMPLIPVLASMEAEGVRIDREVLNDFNVELIKEIGTLETAIHQDAGTTFNIASPKQLGEILYDKLRIIDNPKQTRTRQNSTSEEVLVKMENKHPIIRKILEYRSLTKLKSTYVDVLPTLINPRDGRVHTSYNQAVAATGRLSSNNPNLQNIPIRTEKGRAIRKAFIPRNNNYLLLSADYSQIELRIIAHLSHEQGMIEDFRKGLDIHAATASRVYGVPLTHVDRDMRRNAKMVNFGIIYGISAFGLAERLNISRKEAAEIIHQYFLKYPGIKTYMENTIATAKKTGYVETMMKRRRYLRDITSANATVRCFAERNAINAPIQGTAADMIKIAMIRIFNAMEASSMKSRMILQFHDELVFDAHLYEIETLSTLVEKEMTGAIPLAVPVLVEMKTGKNWLDAH